MRLTPWQRWRMRAYLFSRGMVRRMTFGARVALVDGDRVFLIRHTYMPGWQFPGGGTDPGETIEASAARELREETGYAPLGPMRLFGLYHNATLSDRDHVALFVCTRFEQVRAFRPDREIAEAGWFDRSALPQAISPATARRLAELFEGAPLADTW